MLNKHEKLKQKVKTLPEKPGIYLMKDHLGNVIYVGKAKRLKQRVQSYFQQNSQHSNKVNRLIFNINDFEVYEVDTELDALLLECQFIQEYHPLYNRQMNASENYCYVTLSSTGFHITKEQVEHSYGPFKEYKTLPKICQFLSELYQMPWINYITAIKLQNQQPTINKLSISKRFEVLHSFFTTQSDIHNHYIEQQLDYLIKTHAFEQAATLQQNALMINRFFERQRQINQFIGTKELIFTISLSKQLVKHYQLAYGRIIHTQILKKYEDFQPIDSTMTPVPLKKSELDPALILFAYLKNESNELAKPEKGT